MALDRPTQLQSRLASVDTVRILAILGVICLHCQPFSPYRMSGDSASWHFLFTAISYASRFAVPFFFCIAGYFWGLKIQKGQDIGSVSLSMAKRIASVFFFWLIAYSILNYFEINAKSRFPTALASVSEVSSEMLRRPRFWLSGGFAPHLWFLPALLCSIIIAWVLLRFRANRLLIALSILLYVAGVLARAYKETSVGFALTLFGHSLDTRDGPFFGTLFFVTGYFLSARPPKARWLRIGGGLLTVGLLLQALEFEMIHSLLHAPPVGLYSQDYVFGTYAMGIGATMIALAPWRYLVNPSFARLGRLTLGIYCSHGIFVTLLMPAVMFHNSPLSECLYPIVVLLLSAALSLLLSKPHLTRRFVC
jgi:surface polysaccharide O-acyltransferase-like enzyme